MAYRKTYVNLPHMKAARLKAWPMGFFIVLAIALCTLAIWGLYNDITSLPIEELACAEDNPKGSTAFETCAQTEADRFFKIDYSETKDLAKAFLTLLTAVFVGSVTFSEKIVNVGGAGFLSRLSMLFCWILLLAAIVACGTGLVYMMFALGNITYFHRAVWAYENRAGFLFVFAGTAFGAGLCAMLVAGLPSLFLPKVGNESSIVQLTRGVDTIVDGSK